MFVFIWACWGILSLAVNLVGANTMAMADPGFSVGGANLVKGGSRLPRRLHFKNFVCWCKRIWNLGGVGGASGAPPNVWIVWSFLTQECKFLFQFLSLEISRYHQNTSVRRKEIHIEMFYDISILQSYKIKISHLNLLNLNLDIYDILCCFIGIISHMSNHYLFKKIMADWLLH